ncbi:uncharacterized protein LOC111261449 isoform X1 [Varroa jacobsoni]|uniref:uncharacterized protein LOC111261449 isoform X1 n=2 Tax=Varroa jacobsoni TaxID=62625 RepID=UPI000BF62C52|nr:uncharacterized protein LOC111261449 isoform X1 [Varroa jacobsoni]
MACATGIDVRFHQSPKQSARRQNDKVAIATISRGPDKQDGLSPWVVRVEDSTGREEEERDGAGDPERRQQLVSQEILAHFPLLNHFMPVLLSLQFIGVARTDATISRNTRPHMRIWRLIVWIMLATYMGIVVYSYVVQGAESFLVSHMSQLELTDVVLLFFAALMANLSHNFQRVSFLEIVNFLNNLATKSQLKKQGEAEELRCFLLSLLNWLCHISSAIVYVFHKCNGQDTFQQTEVLIRMLLMNTTLWIQVISASELCWSFAHVVREINNSLMKRVNLHLLLDMRVRYSQMVTAVRDVNRLYSVSLGMAYIHAVTRSSLTLQLFLSQYKISAALCMWIVYETVMLVCLVIVSEASNYLRISSIATATLVSEQISKFRDAPQQMGLTVALRSLKKNTLQLKLLGFIPLSRAFCVLYLSGLICGGLIYAMHDKYVLSAMAATTTL